ncbi:TetR/AcrR family transcriptional regulator [Lachnoclostridium phytofermentans]|uniref:Putative transcriptional regulator, TetR family n=1 Tax=Lachnoclostridium phytofermentans (strain ATCC 700394 / DSM 18823 / ISDg) TaxID=357809 RepID=A9KJQ4_LACP7|nr:TetR/AcrR family transcriptional regulator [Lachnoclostridium phytofermentans]ABX41059.1 putative transcriptional regulator, TetR family [Lachnoclostridium phytofermentans ISDg]
MPPKIKITKEEIMNVAIRMVREKGMDWLNARDLAKELDCSVHPIFRAFNSMEELKSAIYKMAEEIYNERMISAGEISEDGFLNMGLAYIDFAKNEKNLFKLLFMSDAFREQSIMDIAGNTEGDDEVVEMICQGTGLSIKGAKELYTGVWLTTHGVAAMIATNNCKFSDDENRRLLNNSFMGLMLKLKNEEEHL